MNLPDGKTCRDCRHYTRTCEWLLNRKASATECDWEPSKFREKDDAPPKRPADPA
jgi:hypothetical protein